MSNNKIGQILMTKNYDMFRYYDKNRVVSQRKVQQLASAFKNLDLTSARPVIVNEKMEIIDGQHTFQACKLLGRPVYYIKTQVGGKMNDAIISLNANQSPWQLQSYIDNYIKRGKEDYQKIMDCMKEFGVTVSGAISFVSNKQSSGSASIKNGTFKAGKISYRKYGEVYNDLKKITPDKKVSTHIYFLRAVVQLVNSGKYDHKTDFKKFEMQRYEIVGCVTVQQYLAMFERLLNYMRRKDQKIKLQ